MASSVEESQLTPELRTLDLSVLKTLTPQLPPAHPTLLSLLPSLSFYTALSVFLYNKTAGEPT